MYAMELIELLEDAIAGNGGDDLEVRLATQPSWPFEYSITGTYVRGQEEAVDDDGNVVDDDDAEVIFYIGEGTQLDYLPGVVKRGVWQR
jgi:hypothetical protein